MIIDTTTPTWRARQRFWAAMGVYGEEVVQHAGQRPDNTEASLAQVNGASDEVQQPVALPAGQSSSGQDTGIAAELQPENPETLVRIQPDSMRIQVTGSLLAPPVTWTAPDELPSLAGVKRLCPDVETRDEDLVERGPGFRRGAYIVGLGLGTDDGRRWYFPIRHEGGGNMDPERVLRWAREELDKYDGELVNAHILYDLEALALDWGVTFPRVNVIHDVLVAEPLLDEWKDSYSLDATSLTHLGEGKDEALLREACRATGYKDVKANLWRLPAEYVGPYAEADVDRPLRILPIQMAKLEAEGLSNVYSIERRDIRPLLAMRLRGVRVDVDRAQEVRAKLDAVRQRCLGEVRRIAGPQAELRAPDSFVHALTERGLQFQLTPKTGKPSITDAWMEANEGDELVDALNEGREVDTIINTFIDGHILGHQLDGRIYCQYHQLKRDKEGGKGGQGTIARFSSSMPNMTNIPSRDEEIGPLVRGIFLPDDDDEWERADQSQIEYRLLVDKAVGRGSEEAREKYRNDPSTDFHNYCGDMCKLDGKDKTARKRIKAINFGKGYGAQKRKLAILMKCDEDEAKRFIHRYDTSLPFASATFKYFMAQAERDGYITTIEGRRQRFPLWEEAGSYGSDRSGGLSYEAAVAAFGEGRVKRAWTYAALNRYDQGSAADIFKKAVADAHDAGVCDVLGAFLVLVHDEINTSVPRTAEANEAAKELTRIMATCTKLSVPILVDSKRGSNWGAVG